MDAVGSCCPHPAPLRSGRRSGTRIDRFVRASAALLLLAALLLTAAGACSPSRSLEAARILGDIEAGHRPSALKAATPQPDRTFIRFAVDGRQHDADLYIPGEPAKAGLVLVPGLTPRGRDDARLVDFAMTLSRARFKVLVPDLPGMRALQVTALDAGPIADGARYLDEGSPTQPLGIAAVSFAVGPAVIALTGPGVRGRVDFFLGIGAYWDLEALITYITTGWFREEPTGPWTYRPPKAYGKWIFVRSNASRLDDPRDQAALTEIASRKLDDKDAPIEDLVATLGPDGLAVYALIANRDPDRVPSLLASLPARLREEIARLDLKRRDLSDVPVVLILIHDRQDRIIPAQQSEALAAAIAPANAHLYLVDGLDHAQIEQPGVADAVALYDAAWTLLQARDQRLRPASDERK